MTLDIERIAQDISNPPITWHALAGWISHFDIPAWADRLQFAQAFYRAGARLPLQRGRTYRVSALYTTYCQPTDAGVVVAKTFQGVDIAPIEQLYFGASRVKVGEMTL